MRISCEQAARLLGCQFASLLEDTISAKPAKPMIRIRTMNKDHRLTFGVLCVG